MEIWLEEGGVAGEIACPAELRPSPGQYLLARVPEDRTAPLAVPLYPSGYTPGGFTSGPRLPASWLPGTRLVLRGRFGNGFHLPEMTRRLALACLGGTAARLRPLVGQAIERGGAVALYGSSRVSAAPHQPWPADLEIYPLDALPEALTWADFLALDVPLDRLADLPRALGTAGRLSCAAQALVEAPFPCGGIADCGVCAVRTRRGWRLACKDGPVFDLAELALSPSA